MQFTNKHTQTHKLHVAVAVGLVDLVFLWVCVFAGVALSLHNHVPFALQFLFNPKYTILLPEIITAEQQLCINPQLKIVQMLLSLLFE